MLFLHLIPFFEVCFGPLIKKKKEAWMFAAYSVSLLFPFCPCKQKQSAAHNQNRCINTAVKLRPNSLTSYSAYD